MPTYVVTGKLGGGKTLAMVGRMREYIEQGRPVATNITLHLGKLSKRQPKAPVYRLPDRPTAEDLRALGPVHSTGREELNGALVLDECGTWLNSRAWNDKGRADLLDFFLHARKLGWDVFLIVQNLTLLDKQLREALAEYYVICRRLDRLRIPFVGRALSAITFGLVEGRMPKVHLATVRYGIGPSSVHAETWTYRGVDLYGAYETTQVVGTEREGTFCYLVPNPRKPGERPPLKPKLPAVAKASGLGRDEAWRWAARYVAGLPSSRPATA